MHISCQTSQKIIRIMNMLVIFYSIQVGFSPTLWHDSRLQFSQPIVIYSLLFDSSRLDQSQQSKLSTYFVLSTDCIDCLQIRRASFMSPIFQWFVESFGAISPNVAKKGDQKVARMVWKVITAKYLKTCFKHFPDKWWQ